jgi:hypothetical protein
VRRALALGFSLLAVAAPPAGADCGAPRTSADGVPVRPGPALRMGLTPAGEAGALGPAVPVTPISQEKTYAALAQLRPPGDAPFVLRLNRLFWSDGEAGLRRFDAAVAGYTAHGYDVELQVRYHPPAGHDGDVDGFVAFVRAVVRRFGPNPRVVGLQVTNEVNFTVSPDSSDGSFKDARSALVRGVIAASDEARTDGFGQLTIGFNWFYRTDPSSEDAFWNGLYALGGEAFVRAVDWVGLDTYPGTVFPPAEPPGGERDGMVAALDDLRTCEMPKAHLGPSTSRRTAGRPGRGAPRTTRRPRCARWSPRSTSSAAPTTSRTTAGSTCATTTRRRRTSSTTTASCATTTRPSRPSRRTATSSTRARCSRGRRGWPCTSCAPAAAARG